jgi:hypothetical protein
MSHITNDEILGKGRIVTPRTVPHGYQVEQWEKNEAVYEAVNRKTPITYEDFMVGWNAAFSTIYPSQ